MKQYRVALQLTYVYFTGLCENEEAAVAKAIENAARKLGRGEEEFSVVSVKPLFVTKED